MRLFLCVLALFLVLSTNAQVVESIERQLKVVPNAPADLLATRSFVLFDNGLSTAELERLQSGFQQIGIDADFYLDAAKVFAGMDTRKAFAAYITTREVKFVLLLRKSTEGYSFVATEYSNTSQFVGKDQPAWKVVDPRLDELITRIYRDSWLSQKKQNFLINDQPEFDITVPIITGRRQELFPINLKSDMLAVPVLSSATDQAAIDTLFKKTYPYPEMVKNVVNAEDDKDLIKQGFTYLLLYVKCSGHTARELLGYDMTKPETAYGSVSYPNGTQQVKTISGDKVVYKFYIKHIRSGNVFLGTKWDADENVTQALKNHIEGFKAEFNLN